MDFELRRVKTVAVFSSKGNDLGFDLTPIRKIADRIREGRRLCLQGVSPPAIGWLVAALASENVAPVTLVIAANCDKARILQKDIVTWLKLFGKKGADKLGPRVYCFDRWDVLPTEPRLPSAAVISSRLGVLVALSSSPLAGHVVVSDPVALMQKTLPCAYVSRSLLFVEQGQQMKLELFIEWLQSCGYQAEARVTEPGEFSRRGGIVDVYPLDQEMPIRVEFFGDYVESVRTFDPSTQLSVAKIDRVVLGPGGELGLLRRWLTTGLDDKHSHSAEKKSPFTEPPSALYDYLPEQTLVVFAEPEEVLTGAAVGGTEARLGCHQIGESPFYVSFQEWMRLIEEGRFNLLELQSLVLEGPLIGKPETMVFEASELNAYGAAVLDVPRPEWLHAQRQRLFEQVERWLRNGFAVWIVSSDTERERIVQAWQEAGSECLKTWQSQDGSQDHGNLKFGEGELSSGFVCEAARLVVITGHEVFGRRINFAERDRITRQRNATSYEVHFDELEPGDYVVHYNHGIGRFIGLQRLDGPDSEECLVIEYAVERPGQPPPRIYVPISQSFLLTKYVGVARRAPKLDRLRSTRWLRLRRRTEEAIRDFAAELLRVYALRATKPGFAFPADTPWQRDFEALFPYEETPDQLAAIEATKRDMEQPRPMDRLICGDAGFGKTEVAIRAAFKAVMAGKQVAVLAPTTVLALQHYRVFSERMAGFPICIELLSRFKTRAEQERIVQAVAQGQVDILVGTHRVLSPDVQFRDLGLVIIDEEQRFGVEHKERLKILRYEVDVLTLSATPIPRTLYLALAGARDISVIETPPRNRLPVQTIVAPYDEKLVKEAIERELARGGQVFYLHNRIAHLPGVAEKIKQLVPSARVAWAHGRMASDELEQTMTRFVSGEIDILVCTTIVESGLDIPNVNTIIVERADRFGLSELYQLRGRVGRMDRQAYAYLLIPRHARLLDAARKRLSAIRQYSAPGSGFKIAMKDLEIRGAGNILGKEQSGHISAIGFELYCRLLERAIKRLKGVVTAEPPDVRIVLDFLRIGSKGGTAPGAASAFVPEDYISEPSWRIEVYRRLGEAVTEGEIDEVESELRDRFGPLPEPVRYLLEVHRLRFEARDRAVTSIEVRGDRLMLIRGGDYLQIGGQFPRLTATDIDGKLREIRVYLAALRPGIRPQKQRQPRNSAASSEGM